nr:reverse transcriptase domain-containing protein [Tanacetum cinerariifolium]
MCDMVGQYIQKKEEEKQEQAILACYDDDDDDYTIAITHKEPDNSLNIGDEHLDTILATESDEFIKSSVENLIPIPSESEGEHECDVPAFEVFTTFSNILFDADYDFYSSDDQSFYDEDIPKKIYSNPLFDEEIISMKMDQHHFNAESDLIKSLLNHDSSIISSSSKIDSLFDELADELTLLRSILPGINETDCDPEEEIRLIKSELKYKALTDLGSSINLMPLSVWKKLGLPELISTRMTLELANRAICTPAGIARDVFVSLGKFTFPADFVIVDYESDPRVPLILGKPFLRTAHALIDVHDEEMILHDGDERLTLNMRQTLQPSGNPTFSSHPELTSPEVNDDIFDLEGGNVLYEKLLDLDSTKDLYPPLHFDVESDLKEIEFLLHQDIDSSLKDLIDQTNLVDNFVDFMPEMFTDEHALDYSSPSIFDEYDDDFLEVESDAKNVYDDPFDSKGEKIKESKLLIDELDLPCDFLPPFEYESFISQDFSRVDALPSTNNEDKIFNPGILIQEKPVEIITHVVQDKKLAISNASLVLEDFDPPLYEPLFFKEAPKSKMLLSFSSENEEKVFKPGIHTSEKVHSSFILELSHQGYKVFKINQIFKSAMKIFIFYCGKDTHILAVLCHHFYPLDQFNVLENVKTHTKGFCPSLFISSASLGNH